MTNEILSDDELRIAMAEAMGWVNVHRGGRGVLYGMHPGFWTFAPLRIPDWPRDLKAVRQLEESLEREGMEGLYLQSLATALGVYDADSTEGRFALVNASARHRSEAVLMAVRETARL
jgi:hypothetical protein